ncbi:MAG: lysozyme [Hyphomonadaceae bacterium]|nr:MAG: lysozyme [Hyphomonadaceae bacterium]
MSQLGLSRTALDLIKSFEGFRAKAAPIASGAYTIGYGHKATAREGQQITREQAEELLRWDLRPVEDAVRQTCLAPLTQPQFDALVSFAFNIGVENYRKSDVLQHLNQGEPIAAALAISAWRRASFNGKIIIVDALVRRRAAEVSLFLETIGPRPAAPTSVIEPKLDYAAALLVPKNSEIRQAVPINGSGDFTLAQTKPQPADEVATANVGLTPFPEAELQPDEAPVQSEDLAQIEAANQQDLQANPPANDLVAEAKSDAASEPAAKAKPLDAFKGQGVELKAPAPEPIDYSTYIMWAIFAAGLIALVYGLSQLSALGWLNAQSMPANTDDKSTAYWLVSAAGLLSTIVCGYALLREKK